MTNINGASSEAARPDADRDSLPADGPFRERAVQKIAVCLDEESIVQEIFRMLEPHNKSGLLIDKRTNIMKDLDVDSLAVMNFIMNLEDHFDISIPLGVMGEIHTVEDLAMTVFKMKTES